jgi:cytochrome P450
VFVPSSDELARAVGQLIDGYAHNDDDTVAGCLDALAAAPQPFYDEPRHRWLVTRHQHARLVLRNRGMSNDLTRAHATSRSAELARRLVPHAPSLLFLDPPLHTRLRHVLARHFTLAAARARHVPLVDSYLAALDGAGETRPFRVGRDAVHPICLAETLHALGLDPVSDVGGFVDDLYAVNSLFDLNIGDGRLAAARAASERVRRYVASALAESALGRTLRQADIPSDVAVSTVEFMLRSGVVTTGSLLIAALSEVVTCGAPRPVRDGEHLLVTHSPTLDTGRITTRATHLHGPTIPAGNTVIILLAAANRDLLRQTPAAVGNHLVFGAGRHRCLASHLVRAHLEALTQAVATVRMDPSRRDVTPHRTPTFRGLREVAFS